MNELYCKIYHISIAPCWSNVIHHVLTTSIKYTTKLVFFQILNIICTKQPTQNEIDDTFSSCYIESNLLSYIDNT